MCIDKCYKCNSKTHLLETEIVTSVADALDDEIINNSVLIAWQKKRIKVNVTANLILAARQVS